MTPFWKIMVGDCRVQLGQLDDESVQTVVTSPPYYGLRDYGTGEWEGGDGDCDHVRGELRRGTGLAGSAASTRGGGHKAAEVEDMLYGARCEKCGAERVDEQIGLEETPEDYVEQMVAVFREVRRVLRHDGTAWLNLGDSYNSGEGMRRPSATEGYGKHDYVDDGEGVSVRATAPGLKPKDLIGIPWRVAFALQADGWYLRSEVIWAKPNPMPESVTDRPTKAHEQVFLLTKSARYFYDADAIREPHSQDSVERVERTWHNAGHKWEDGPGRHDLAHSSDKALHPLGRNRRSVWEVATVPYKEAHFATFPPKLVDPCIKAGTPEAGACQDCGAPWTRIAARQRKLDGEEVVDGGWDQDDAGRIGAAGVGHWRYTTTSETLGWRPTCVCGANEPGLSPDDLDLIESPAGAGGTEDPSIEVGRAGYSRPRGDDAGRRTITRYQQRGYAEQLKQLPKTFVAALVEQGHTTGEAWAHYRRTDRAGARPLPPKLLAHLLADGTIFEVGPPDWTPVPTRPSTVLDPFSGAGTTGLVALRLERNFVGVELSAEYAEQARHRIRDDAPLFNVGTEALESAGDAA